MSSHVWTRHGIYILECLSSIGCPRSNLRKVRIETVNKRANKVVKSSRHQVYDAPWIGEKLINIWIHNPGVGWELQQPEINQIPLAIRCVALHDFHTTHALECDL